MAEEDLSVLLSAMNPRLDSQPYIFATLSEERFRELNLEAKCYFREDEGITLILAKSLADGAGLYYDGQWAMITCQINSSLAAVGFLAKMATLLAQHGIAANAVSAFYHDHLFVPAKRATEALELLQSLTSPANISEA